MKRRIQAYVQREPTPSATLRTVPTRTYIPKVRARPEPIRGKFNPRTRMLRLYLPLRP